MEDTSNVLALVFSARDARTFLAQFLRDLQTRTLVPADVVYVIKTVARELLRPAYPTGTCPQTELFADWIVHNEIDRSPIGQRAIATVAEAFPLHGSEGRDEKWLEEQVNDSVSFGGLRLELLGVCQRFQLPDELFTSWESWQKFAIPLGFEVSGRRIVLGTKGKASRDARERIDASVPEATHRPSELMVVIDQNQKFWWRIETTGGIAIVMQVLFGSYRASDFPMPSGWISPLIRRDGQGT